MPPRRTGVVLVSLSWGCDPHRQLVETRYQVVSSLRELAGRTISVVVTDDPNVIADLDQSEVLRGNPHRGVILLVDPDAIPDAVESRIDVQLPRHASPRELTTAIDLVLQIVEQRGQLESEQQDCQRWFRLAMQDALTGLPNRRGWDLQLEIQLANRSPVCVGLVDVDLFGQVNQRSGYDVGDRVLHVVASSLRRRLHRRHFVARLGGDEFGILLASTDRQAGGTLDRLRRAVTEDLSLQGLPAPTVSIGYCAVSARDLQQAQTAQAVYTAAARALQAAKRLERNRVVASMAEPSDTSNRQLEIKSS